MKFKYLALIAIVVLTFTGCKLAPIHNVSDMPVSNLAQAPTLDKVSEAIITAGNGLGWSMKEDKPGHILGQLFLRTHIAIVDIDFSRTTYSITYKDSTNLKYDGSQIHKAYNGWILNLDNAIKRNLSML